MGLTWAESVETKMQKKANERNIEPSRTTKAGSFLSIFTQGNKLRIYDQQANDNWAEFKNSHAEAAEERGVWEKGHHAEAAEERSVWEKVITQLARGNPKRGNGFRPCTGGWRGGLVFCAAAPLR